MVASLSEVFCTQFDFSDVLLAIKILTHIHNRVEIVAFTINLDGLFVLLGLDIKISSFFPVVAVTLELGLFYKNGWIEERTFARAAFAVLSDQVIGLLELL